MIIANINVSGNSVEISCTDVIERSVYWHCNVQGTFTVSKNSGEIKLSSNNGLFIGNETITIKPLKNQGLLGYIEFVFDDELCPEKWRVNISGKGETYIFSVTPLYVTLEGNGSSQTVHVESTKGDWFIQDGNNSYYDAVKSDNETITVTSKTDEPFENISFIVSDNITTKRVTVSQEEVVECTLDCIKTPDSGSTYQVSVASYSGSSFISYNVDISRLENFGYTDDKLGNVNVFVKDLSKDASGIMTISNECKSQDIIFSFTAEEVIEEEFVIYNGNNEYTAVTINFGDFDSVSWNGSQINMPYDAMNDLLIRSTNSLGTFCMWQPTLYNTDRIQLQYEETKLSIQINDTNPLSTHETITLQNDCGKQIIISYTISDGLFVEDTYVFGVGAETGNKSNVYNIEYSGNEISVYIDSYLLQKDNSTNIAWNCISTDPVIGYIVQPMNYVGGSNNKITITADSTILDQIENDYVGVVKFQQLDGDYLECQVNISHKAKPKEWYEVSRKLITYTLVPTSVELGHCEEVNYSEEITCSGQYEVEYQLKTSQDSDISYGTKTEYVNEEKGYTKVIWEKQSGSSDEIEIETLEHTDENGTYYTYRCYAPENLYLIGSYRTAIFVGTLDTTTSVDNVELEIQCNQNTSTMIGEDIEGETTVEGVYINFEMVDEDFDEKEDIIPRTGDTRVYLGSSAELKITILREDDCGNVLPGYDDEKTEVVQEPITIKTDKPEMLQLDDETDILTITENPWVYTFTSSQEINESLEWFEEAEYTVNIHSDRKASPRIGYIWAVYTDEDGVEHESHKKQYEQEGGDEYVEYKLISKPSWCEVTLPSSFGYDTQVTVKIPINEDEEDRLGDVILEQVLPETGERKQIIFKVQQDGMIYTPLFGCQYTPIPIGTYILLRYQNINTGQMLVEINKRNTPNEIGYLEYNINYGRANVRPYGNGYTVVLAGGATQQETSDALMTEVVNAKGRSDGAHWFHGHVGNVMPLNPPSFIFHEIHQRDQNNGSWGTTSFNNQIRSCEIILFGFYYKNE